MIVELRSLCGMTPWSDARKLKMLGKTVNIMSRGSFHKAILATIDLSYLWLILWLPALIFTSVPRSDVRLTVKSVRFRFQKINRNRNRDLEKKPYFRFLVLFFIHALKCLCKSWLTTQITPVLCGNTLKKESIKAKTVKCKLCTKDIAADYGNASILRRHIENKHKSEFEGLKKKPH